jgi:ABC-type branched-subunit amino acid transport system permease subunit
VKRHLLRELALLATVLVLFVVIFPLLLSQITLINLTVFAAMATLALSMALVWGYGGILSFGQSAFFGLGGYAYAIGVLNLGESTLPILFGIIVPVAFALILGYFMFYGRIGDIYLGVITLVVSLILYQLVSSTSGSNYRIGIAPIGGYDGLPALPPINMPGNPGLALDYTDTYRLAAGVLIIGYFGLRLLLASHFGKTIVAIKENERRMEFLGYDVRARKLVVFAIAAGIAGLAGVLFANWGSFISPNVFSVGFTAQIIMWIMIGGLGTLIGPVIGSVVVQTLVTWLGAQKFADTNIVLGFLFVAFVMLVPKGLVPALRDLVTRLRATSRLEQ